jgi:hypothetical protein
VLQHVIHRDELKRFLGKLLVPDQSDANVQPQLIPCIGTVADIRLDSHDRAAEGAQHIEELAAAATGIQDMRIGLEKIPELAHAFLGHTCPAQYVIWLRLIRCLIEDPVVLPVKRCQFERVRQGVRSSQPASFA